MKIRDLLYETWQSLLSNKARNLLTVLGVVIGISAVIAMTAMIGGIKQGLYSDLGMDQSRMLTMYGSSPTGQGITLSDLDAMERNLPGYEFVTGVVQGYTQVQGEKDKAETFVMGVEPLYFQARSMRVEDGAFFTDADVASRQKVVVVDEELSRDVFGNGVNPVGRTVRLRDLGDCRVVGVIASSGSGSGGTAYVPLTTAEPVFGEGGGSVGTVIGFAREGVDPTALGEQTKEYLATLLHVSQESLDSYISVITMKEIMEQLDSFMGAFQVLMTAVASVSLLVGGIGIMNMMLTNVTERIREIGLRKALGARRSSIVAQFLFESIALTLVGGLFGTILGYAGAALLSGIAGALFIGEGVNVAPVISPEIVIGTVSICVLIGVLFGIYPAQRAARLDPVESLRHQ